MQKINLIGYRCPVVATLVKRHMKKAEPGVEQAFKADDPSAPKDIAALCNTAGWKYVYVTENDEFTFFVTKPV